MSEAVTATKRVALVTGASSGIGAAIAHGLAAKGLRVFGTARKPVPRSDGIESVALDVTDDASVTRCVDEVIKKAGRIDVLVNNAGYLVSGAIEETSLADARAQLETNFFGVARMVQAVLPSMREQKSGHIITVSSLAGLVPVPFWGYYSASKFAVEGLMESLRFEMKPFGVQVAMVEPGAIKTPFYAQPKSEPLAAYAPWRGRFEATMHGFEEKAPGPELVAARVVAIAHNHNPALRNKVTREAGLFTFLRWALPAGLYESGVRKGFALDG